MHLLGLGGEFTRLVPHIPPFIGMPSSPEPPSSWMKMPIRVPRKAPMAVTNCAPMAARLEKPDWMRSAKSPTSWGISCRKTARVVLAPRVGEA